MAGAVLAFVGVRQGLVVDEPAAAFGSGPLLLVLAALPAVLAIVCVLLGRAPTAAGVLTGAALLAPGLALVDAQFIQDALLASRPEIMVPTSLAALTPAAGVYLLLAGHLAAAVAGVLAAGHAGADPDSDYYAALDAGRDERGRGRAIGWALAAGAVSVVGLLFAPFESDNAFIVAQDLVASPALVRYGGLLIVLTVLIGAVAAAVNTRPPLARGMALGLFVALAWLVVPQLAAVARVDWLHLTPWPLRAIIPVGLLAAALFVVGDRGAREKADIQLAGSPVVTGVLGVLTGVATIVAGVTALVVAHVDQPESYANRQLLPAGIVLVLLSAALFTRAASAVRPALVVALGAVPLVGLAALDTAFTATTLGTVMPGFPVAASDTRVGAAVWFTIAAFVLAAAAAIAAGITGGAERDDVDRTQRAPHLRYGIPAAGAVLFAIGAFASPMIRAPGFAPPGIFTEFRLASWGLLIGLLVIVGAAVVASFARPARAAALLFGAAVVAGVRLLELPLTGDRVSGAHAGGGTWLTLACLVTLVAAAVAAATDPHRGQTAA
ncbi:hypothetical protein [Actinophytocola sp.]|uniref:hypothetical protein n=1 Tax=Actinophytocola sp. TaxID=1872138 RepID=UPI00389B330A